MRSAQLQSNVLTHDDDKFRASRDAQFDLDNKTRIGMASNAGWNA